MFRHLVGVRLHYFTDPLAAASWAAEPSLRRLLWEFGADPPITYVMGGVAREVQGVDLTAEWLDVADRTGMPVDPRFWSDGGVRSSYPACIAVKAAGDQGQSERYLRAAMEAAFCFRRKVDSPEVLIDIAREAGLDVQRFRIDLASNASVEAFGNDLERVRTVPEQARAADVVVSRDGHDRVPLPTLRAQHDDGRVEWVFGPKPFEEWRAAVGGTQREPPSAEDALRRFGRMATAEIAGVCHLPGPRAHAELWRMAAEWRIKPTRVLTGWLWEIA